MDPGLTLTAGRCRRCARPYTSGEVVGRGILRPRAVIDGGPIVEFTCPGCRTVIPLVPHGSGRFAAPGEPPPPPPTDAERRVPWERPREAPPAAAAPPPRPPPRTTPPPAPPPPPTDDDALPTTALEALTILGVGPHALEPEIERAYRALALKLHPDKVAHLDADFVALAERKFRRLQAARDLLLGPR
ncbi:MAG: J domain-containing protein [Planctomycetota bacterium]